MDDEDDDVSSSSPPPPLPISVVHPSSLLPPSNGHPFASVTVATPSPHHQTLTLALPIQPPIGSSSGGREDCWSEGATSALIDAWGDHFLDLSRGNVKQKHWQEIAEVVSSRDDYTKPPRSDIQCKNRIDTLKKKYKIEKSKISSSWVFFDRLDFLLGPIIKTPISTTTTATAAAAALSRFPQKQRTSMVMKRKNSLPLPPPASGSSTSNSLPPDNGRRRRVVVAGMGELTRAILKFGEVYQRVESSKLQQVVEMEKQRIGFSRELEMQRMEFFMKTQMELSQLGGGGSGSSNNYLHHGRRRHRSSGNGNNNGMSG